jgi:hypothetical protein
MIPVAKYLSDSRIQRTLSGNIITHPEDRKIDYSVDFTIVHQV